MMTAVIWTLCFLGAIGFFVYQLYGRFGALIRLRRDDGRDYSLATLPRRIKNLVVYGFAQKKFFLREQGNGIVHVIVFWGFLVLAVQVKTMFLRGWFPEFHVPFFGMDGIGGPYAFIKDIFQFLVMVGVVVALLRWLVLKPQRLFGILPAEKKLNEQTHGEAYLILVFIFTIMASGFLYDAGRIVALAANDSIRAEAAWQPISAMIASLFESNPDLASWIIQVSWWTHNLVILVFLNLLPRSKHFHIITALPNVFFGKLESKGRLAKKDYSGENPIFGTSQAFQFTWKQGLDMYSCTECGRCSAVCPAAATGKSLAPRQFLLNLRDNLYEMQPQMMKLQTAGGAATPEGFDVVVGEGKSVIDDVIWSCVACRACEEACPVNIEYVDKIMDIRQHLVQEASRFPAELGRMFKGLETQSNPWGISSADRSNWAEGLDVPVITNKPDAEILYYVGCGGSFDDNNKKGSRALVNILKKAGVSFATLGNCESCNGETARRAGNEYLFQNMAEVLTKTLKDNKVKRILTNCPHCYNTLKNDYKEFGADWEVEHAAGFVTELVKDKKITMEKEFNQNVVYHDSCYYGRFNDIFEAPRELIKSVKGATLTEMDQNRSNSTCCGGGGARMWMEEDADKRVNVMRTEQALGKKPDVIATSCPYCRIMLTSGVNEKGASGNVAVMDVIEVIEKNMAT